MDVECGWDWISKSKQGKQSKFIQQKGQNCLTNQWWSHTGSILATQERIRSYCWFFPSDVGFVKEVSFQDILHWMVCSGSRGCCGNPLVGNDWYAGVREAMGACGRDTSVAAIATQTSWSRCYFENGIGDCDWQFEEPWSCCWQCWKDNVIIEKLEWTQVFVICIFAHSRARGNAAQAWMGRGKWSLAAQSWKWKWIERGWLCFHLATVQV